jgi:hypothetical protein
MVPIGTVLAVSLYLDGEQAGERRFIMHRHQFRSCTLCQHFLSWDKALAGEDPWMSMEHAARPYASCKGCDVFPEPEKKAFADLSDSERCVTQAVARRINTNFQIVVKGSRVFDPTVSNFRRQHRTIQEMEYEAMQERAEFCDFWFPRGF